MANKLNVAFIHPDLGIGGAERLIVDAALGLQQKGHRVVLYTSHHDANHAFKETTDGTLLVRCHGDFLPRHFYGRFHVVFAILRSLYLASILILHNIFASFFLADDGHGGGGDGGGRYDIVVCDQISAPIPILRLFGLPVFFYCHFPDLHLSNRTSFIKKLYRIPIDILEGITTTLSNRVVVNSQYTRSVYMETFFFTKVAPSVLYPAINFKAYQPPPPNFSISGIESKYILSINRFERKKRIDIALRAFALLPKGTRDTIQLVLAGGYDPFLQENREYFAELQEIARSLQILDRVVFFPNFNETERAFLLRNCFFLVYTPTNEHFGIVPVEAMYCQVPVVASRSGGLLETMLDGVTGWLSDPDSPESFAKNFQKIIRMNVNSRASMGAAGKRRVTKLFSLENFSDTLETHLYSVLSHTTQTKQQSAPSE